MSRSAISPFVDTNVLLHLLSSDASKADCAEAILAKGIIVGVQVLNEFTNVARRKIGMSWEEISDVLGLIRQRCTVRPLTLGVHEQALLLASRYGLSWFDALIAAAAFDAGCVQLLSEDMQDGLRMISPLNGEICSIANPFAPA